MQNTKQSSYTERIQRGLHWFNKSSVGPHLDKQASKLGTKYYCLSFLVGSPYMDHTLVCWMHLCNSLRLRADLARKRILCSTRSKQCKPQDNLTSEPFLPSDIIFWHRADANNTRLWIDNFQFCCCRSSGGGGSGGGWWQSALKKLVVFRGNMRWKC